MTQYEVRVTIENKPGISDPEGQTILNDLVLKRNVSSVSQIKSAKLIKFFIEEKNEKIAQKTIQKICDDLRIYNPMVSQVTIDVVKI